MFINFTKMHGCGNDYIYINGFKEKITNPEKPAIELSDRHFGIGGDGVILILPSDKADARMRMFNLDGSEGKMCGNGIRCVAKYLYDYDVVKKEHLSVETLGGIKYLDLNIENGEVSSVKVDMGAAILESMQIPVKSDLENIIDYDFEIEKQDFSMKCKITCVSMGNPHCVVFTSGIDKMNLEKIGPHFEKNEFFPEGVNTEFIEIIDSNTLNMRVWERGSGETLACGTGACAAVVAAVLNGYCKRNEDVKVKLIGGELLINYSDTSVFMTGPCTKVFDGMIEFKEV
ncbi:MAG: diaminopimelate epimerase [Clostridia bacterium]